MNKLGEKLFHKFRVNSTSLFLRRLDSSKIPNNVGEIRVFAVARNESLRLPYFIKYYFEKSVDRIFIIDNQSTDDTVEIALQHMHVHVFQVNRNYKNHWDWVEYFLDTHGIGHWCIVVDIDELIYFPRAESISLRNLAEFLERENYSAMRFLLLEMYSDKPIIDTIYVQGQDPLDVCKFFDPEYETLRTSLFDKKAWEVFETIVYRGGMRDRVFGGEVPKDLGQYDRLPYLLSKISLFKNTETGYLTQGMHALSGAFFTDLQGVVFHTKYMSDFITETYEESRRQQHFGNAIMYKIFKNKIVQNRNLSLKYPGSVELVNASQLVDMKLMSSSRQFEIFAGSVI